MTRRTVKTYPSCPCRCGKPSSWVVFYETRQDVTAVLGCGRHTQGGYQVPLEDLLNPAEAWIEHLRSKPWRGDLVLERNPAYHRLYAEEVQ